MNPNAPRSRSRNVEADAYWRRRFCTLLAGLGVLGLLAWAFSGTVGGTPHQGPGSGQSGAGNASAAAYGTAAPGLPASAAMTPTAPPSGQASVFLPASSRTRKPPATAPAQTRTNKAKAKKNGAAGRGGHAAPATAGKHGCPARDIVLTLLTSKASYGPGEQPKFQIDIVSTDAAACTLNVGRASLRVLITSGSRADWDSGACLRGATARAESLRRGIPSVVSITWDRRLRAGGCSEPTVTAAHGRYAAMAVAGSVVSQAKAFRLR
jgi:hypothetical protein